MKTRMRGEFEKSETRLGLLVCSCNNVGRKYEIVTISHIGSYQKCNAILD